MFVFGLSSHLAIDYCISIPPNPYKNRSIGGGSYPHKSAEITKRDLIFIYYNGIMHEVISDIF